MAAIAAILGERRRQVEVEGFDPLHDDREVRGQLFYAACCYRDSALSRLARLRPDGVPVSWPWEPSWWKPRHSSDDLVRSGALFLAEAARRRRVGENPAQALRGLRMVVADMCAGARPALPEAP